MGARERVKNDEQREHRRLGAGGSGRLRQRDEEILLVATSPTRTPPSQPGLSSGDTTAARNYHRHLHSAPGKTDATS
jgi:hypothetical protein